MKRTLKLITTLALFWAMASHATETATKEQIKEHTREIQQMLTECGFNAGPDDGIWGKRTTQAARAYVRAHGWTPSNDKVLLLAQVDGYRVGDAGPCPPAGTHQASEDSGPTAEAGSVEADQAEEVETGGIKEIITELDNVLGKPLQKVSEYERYNVRYREYAGFEFSENSFQFEEKSEQSDMLIPVTSHNIFKMNYSDIGMVGGEDGRDQNNFNDPNYSGSFLRLGCREEKECVTVTYSPGDVRKNAWLQPLLYHESTTEAEYEAAVALFNQLKDHYDGGGTTTGQPVKCYNWVKLGTFHLGKWRNGNGRETSGLPAGSGIKIWDDEELLKDYKAARQHCVSSANGAMDSAITAMVLIGRKAKDVDNEKIRIRNFYQASLDKCQAEFKKRFLKYENKFCE